MRAESVKYILSPIKFKFVKTVRIIEIVFKFLKSFKCLRIRFDDSSPEDVLTRFQMFDLDKTFSMTSNGLSLTPNTIFSIFRNLHVLQDSIRRLKGHEES